MFLKIMLGLWEKNTRELNIKAIFIWETLRDLVPFVQFKKLEKHLWMSVTSSKAAGY